MKKLLISPLLSPVSTEVFFGRGLLSLDLFPKNAVIIADEKAAEMYGKNLASRLNVPLLNIASQKSKENCEKIYAFLAQVNADRHTHLIALGGGSVCDLAAFAASTFMRGIPLILVPTTLLAMVDAAIGGKTAIDTPWGKNLIGSIYFPKAIIVDLDTLTTLPEKEWLNGRAEILKMGLVFDPSLWNQCLDDDLILKAMQAKISVIERDPFEFGLRRILNFGHTIGHGLEHLSKNEMPHGMAVALGSLAEAHLSMQVGMLSQKEFDQIKIPYQQFPLALPCGYTRKDLIESMKHDKKKRGDELRFVMIEEIGKASSFKGLYCRYILPNELNATLDWMEVFYTEDTSRIGF